MIQIKAAQTPLRHSGQPLNVQVKGLVMQPKAASAVLQNHDLHHGHWLIDLLPRLNMVSDSQA